MAGAKAVNKGVSETIEKFLAKIKQGTDFTCTGYHRMMYKQEQAGKYSKASPELMQKIAKNLYVSADGREWICNTCDSSLGRGVLPVQAKANGMELDPKG